MASPNDDLSSPFTPLLAELARMRRANLSTAIKDVDALIETLLQAREQVAADADARSIQNIMMSLQTPVKHHLESINNDLKEVTRAQKSYGKALDKAMPQRELPAASDAMAERPDLINRAVTMHLLREGQFSVASTFLREETEQRRRQDATSMARPSSVIDSDGDNEMVDSEQAPDEHHHHMMQSLPQDLQAKFATMYNILGQLKKKNLEPAIQWARHNSSKLEAGGSDLEFDLCKLQFVWLFKGPAENGLPDDDNNGQKGALAYATQHFARFQSRHLKTIEQLCCALVFASNLGASPYRHLFEIDSAFDDVASSFTREFCSMLGLAAESPLYVAVTAGSLALPRLIKYTTYMKQQKTEWTSENELAFETPLPESMIYHPIFVCPVSKEQATEENPPTMMTCGHVICRDSLQRIAKGSRYKCPYCPTEGHLRDSRPITL
ncbi:hypothetical protein CDD82_6012 [Ophiocordyceps australis]|uniref:GID complex catalytic subunit 2 n=1 Tax=Ophiocordyceps australis TaxID=1399860 RepID=A0A2C5ZKB9_9HYPO|nr:hypothetical protein CDD82_6012 [Ophiocordyceps australis]